MNSSMLDGVSARISGVGVHFRQFDLEPVTLDLAGGCTALLGTNGAGKTTLMRAMLGLERRATGHLEIGDLRSDSRTDRPAFRRAVGWVPQRPEFPRLVTVRQCLQYAADLKGLRGEAARAGIDRAAESTDLTRLLRRSASALSGGQQQRLAIAQAIVHQPRFLLMDEPTAGLDPVQRLDFRDWLASYSRQNDVLISTHLIEDVKDVSLSTIVLHDGRLAFAGSTEELLGRVQQGGVSLDEAAATFLRELAR